ncbi:MAG: DUF3830 family protein [Bacteroidota bacterium]
MTKYIELKFVEDNIAVRARLLEEEMPRTCNELIKHLPLESVGTHARYSGSEVAMLLSTEIKIGKEKATSSVETGDIAYVWLNQDDHYGLDDDVSEICWFYDKDSTPTMAEGPVRVNIFAKIEGDATEFYKASADTRITGVRNVRISLIEE